MPKPTKDLDDDIIKDIIKTETEHKEDRVIIPTTSDIRDGYEERTGDGVHRKTMRNYLIRNQDLYTMTQVSDYMGWRVSE